MVKKTIRDLDIAAKRVIMRVDYNVPIDKKTGAITDDTRIKKSLPTIEYILSEGASLILMSHLGRPKGQASAALRLTGVGEKLSELLGRKVIKLNDCIGPEVEAGAKALKGGEVLLLENLRFYAEEEKDDPVFAARLAALADIYVNDAFGTAHRAHASTEGIARLLPAVAGFLMEKEILFLGRLLENPGRPYLAVLGGAKVSDKLKVIKNLLGRVDAIAIGGAMAYTFLKAGGARVGMSLVEDEMLGSASEIMEAAASKKVIFLLPSDHVVASAVSEDAAPQAADEKGIPEGLIGLDIGPETVKKYGEVIKTAKTIFWNGPMGVFEMKPFSKGTYEVAAMIAASGATTVVGGGDSISALKKSGYEDKISHISTGGGASLEFLEGLELPGIKALNNR